MGHSIKAIILKGKYNRDLAKKYDLIGNDLSFDLTLFPINHYYSAYWQAKLKFTGILPLNGIMDSLFPCERSIYELLKIITKHENIEFAIISTDYFGGIREQDANVYINDKLADKSIKTINQVLSFLGVIKNDSDEFDAVGLGNYRSLPEYLEKYIDLADELGV